MDDYEIIILAFILVGILEIILGIPLLLEKIKPNWLYGFRLPYTLSSDEIWYKSNKYVGRDFIVAGFIVILGSLFLLVFKTDSSVIGISLVSILLIILPIIIILIRAFNYLKEL